jgi:hypothetical protein
LNVGHFHEKLGEEHQIGLSYTWVKQALQAADLVKRKAKRGVHRKRRERRPLPVMMLHIDGKGSVGRRLRRLHVRPLLHENGVLILRSSLYNVAVSGMTLTQRGVRVWLVPVTIA